MRRLNKYPTVVFILHPLKVSEFRKNSFFYSPFELIVNFLLKIFNDKLIRRIYSIIPPHKILNVKELSINNKIINLKFIMCTVFPADYFRNRKLAINKILRATEKAYREGGNIVVLAGITSIATNQGLLVKEKFRNKIDFAITTGNSLTAALVIRGVENACNLFKVNLSNTKLAIIGATGDIGGVCVRYFLSKVKCMNLCARNIDKNFLNNLKEDEGGAKLQLSNNISEAILDADIIILSTSSYVPLIEEKDVKRSAIIADVSLPYNVDSDFSNKRSDVFVFDAGKACLPEKYTNLPEFKKYIGLEQAIHGCLAEGIILGLENEIRDFSLGRQTITLESVEEIWKKAQKYQISLSKFAFQGKYYSEEKIISYKKQFGYDNTIF